jgi:1-acyl-sn-glycerol-3-phosphate acyltransferase
VPEARVIPLNGGEPARVPAVEPAPSVVDRPSRRTDDQREVLRVDGRSGDTPDTIDLTERAARRSLERAAAEAASAGDAAATDGDAGGREANGGSPVLEAETQESPEAGWAEALVALEEAASAAAEKAGGDVRHLGPDEAPDWEKKLAGALAFARRRITGEYEVDEFGFDPDLTAHVLATALRPVYEKWFRVETRGMENLPDDGSALVVANHSGTIPVDAAMTTLAIYDHHPAHRHLRMLGADLVFQVPFLAPLARKTGSTLACQADAERLLSSGELVGVWPEGFKGVGKPYSERYKLQRFGRGGFVSSALRTGAPIIPCSIVGAEEIYPMIGNLKTLARLFGLPYLPVTPTFPLLGPLGLVPLPSKWIIEFGEPVETASYGAAAADDPMTVFNLTDQVRETIQGTLYKLLMQRRSVFF